MDSVNQSDECLQNFLKGDIPIKFDWANRWLKGDEYAHILSRIEEYCDVFALQKFTPKTHPECIYLQPQNGLIYFVRGTSIGSDFGFPRLAYKKKFKWKKMNFTTDLPKKDPLVSYIVASAVKCQKFFPESQKEGPVYRMHAVILKKRPVKDDIQDKGENCGQSRKQSQSVGHQNSNPKEEVGVLNRQNSKTTAANKWVPAQNATKYILCHVRKVTSKKPEEDESDSQIEVESLEDNDRIDQCILNQNRFRNQRGKKQFSSEEENKRPSIFKENEKEYQQIEEMKTSFESIQRSLASGCELDQPALPKRRRALTEAYDQMVIEQDNKHNVKQLESGGYMSNFNSQSIKNLNESDLEEEEYEEDSEYHVSNSKRQKKRDVKSQRKLQNTLIIGSRNCESSKDAKMQLTQAQVFQSPEAQFLKKQNQQEKKDKDLQRDAQLFAHQFTLQKRQKRSESFDQVSHPQIDEVTTTSLNQTSQVFNFTESLSKLNMLNSPTQNITIPCNSAQIQKLFRKSSEIVGEREKLSAFKKLDQLQRPQPINSQVLGLQHIMSPNVNHLLFQSPFSMIRSKMQDLQVAERNDMWKLQNNLLQSILSQQNQYIPNNIHNNIQKGNQMQYPQSIHSPISQNQSTSSQKLSILNQLAQNQSQNYINSLSKIDQENTSQNSSLLNILLNKQAQDQQQQQHQQLTQMLKGLLQSKNYERTQGSFKLTDSNLIKSVNDKVSLMQIKPKDPKNPKSQ